MMVSIATAVLPVWRSPMISSRWPRPIGTMASIALRPVCTGCDTDWRAITPGATFSITSVSLALIGPLPSMGCPRELTTLPSSSGPMGTDRILPVVLTVSPSVMCWYSPRITEPTESRSRLSARPKVFFGNSSISPCITSDRPWMRQMPSVTDTTVPSVRMRAPASRFWMRLLISSEISDGLSCIRLLASLLLSLEGGFERAELRARRAVDDLVAEHHAHAGDQRLVDLDFGSDFAAGLLLQPLHQVGDLGFRQLERGLHFGLEHAFTLILQRLELRADLRQQSQAAVFGEHAQKILGFGVQPAREDADEHAGHLRIGLAGLGHRGAHACIVGDQRQGAQHFGPFGERAGAVGQPEGRFGVGSRYGAGFGHYSCRLIASSSSPCAFASTSRRRIFSAPATASDATWSRSCSRARVTCCSISALAAAFSRLPSSLAAFLASSIICAARFSACASTSAARLRAWLIDSSACRVESSSERLPCSAAARPSATCFCRASMARSMWGQMNFTVTHMKAVKVIACATSVRFKFMTAGGRYWKAVASGLAKAKNIAMPRPMMNEASIRPSSRNTLPCSELVSSGWRAAASRKRLHMMPTPMHAPAAPSPIISPMPMPVYAWTIASSWSFSI